MSEPDLRDTVMGDGSAEIVDDTQYVWDSTSSATQIQSLGRVEREIASILQLAASSMRLLALPETEARGPDSVDRQDATDGPTSTPLVGALSPREAAASGEERAELFVDRANQYFRTLADIQFWLRRSLYDLRQKRISPNSIVAPSEDFVPPVLGLRPPTSMAGPESNERSAQIAARQGLQETRVERNAWLGIATSLQQLKELQEQDLNE